MVRVGAVTHLVFTARQISVWSETPMERVVQARLIVPTDQLDTMGRAILRGSAETPTVGTGENEEAMPTESLN